jgi:hypothetical protein
MLPVVATGSSRVRIHEGKIRCEWIEDGSVRGEPGYRNREEEKAINGVATINTHLNSSGLKINTGSRETE